MGVKVENYTVRRNFSLVVFIKRCSYLSYGVNKGIKEQMAVLYPPAYLPLGCKQCPRNEFIFYIRIYQNIKIIIGSIIFLL